MMNKRGAKPDIGDAEHPARQAAIRIIESVIEPLVGRGIEGEEYYALEDAIVNEIVVRNIRKQRFAAVASRHAHTCAGCRKEIAH